MNPGITSPEIISPGITGAGINPEPLADITGVWHRYNSRTVALRGVDLSLRTGALVGLIGPDGVGKSTLLGLLAGAKRIQTGTVRVLGGDMADEAHRNQVCPRIAFMPQGLGRNLYQDLSVAENIGFFGALFGQDKAERGQRMDRLLHATGLAGFADRPARNLSGGMKQKLGLCCSLIHDPDLLILDEPTTGVDPLSRRQFWDLIARLRAERPAMTVIVATAYMEEADGFDELAVMYDGRILATGTPDHIRARTGCDTLQESFIALLPAAVRAQRIRPAIGARKPSGPEIGPEIAPEIAVEARDLTRRFGAFTAVDGVSFTIQRGEIFGFVGSNGCGKTTTMKMLTGLLPATSGYARLFGQNIGGNGTDQRGLVGYMSQSFSLYTELTARQNLDLHARLYHLPPTRAKARVAELARAFGLSEHMDTLADAMPLGMRQRLSLAVAVVHEPALLILDEPTSGVDPLARDQFWCILGDLSRQQGVTIFVSTHFMDEAARCDRLSLMHAGRVLATGRPADLVHQAGAASLEEAFIAALRAASTTPASGGTMQPAPLTAAVAPKTPLAPGSFSLRRMLACARKEALELRRDHIRLGFAVFGVAILFLAFGFGVNTDVDNVAFAVLDRDHTTESRAYVKEFSGSAYFSELPAIAGGSDLERRLASGEIKLALEIPPGFGRDVRHGRPAEVGAWIDGAMPFRAQTILGYLQGVHQNFLADLAATQGISLAALMPVTIETRFRYNQSFDSINALVPGDLAMLLALIPAILMALAVVREKELGSITNLYVTPVTRTEFILGKQLPYVAVSMLCFVLLVLMAVFLFGVALKGSLVMLVVATVIYLFATTAYGLLISAFAGSQIAALFGTAILTVIPATQFAGMLAPVSSLTGAGAVIGKLFPMSYFLPISVGVFTKGLGFAELAVTLFYLSLFVPGLLILGLLALPKQEK